MSYAMDPVTRKTFVEERLKEITDLLSPIATNPELDDLHSGLQAEQTQLQAERQRLEYIPSKESFLEGIDMLRNGKTFFSSSIVSSDPADLAIDMNHLIVCAYRKDLEIAFHQAILAKAKDIHSIAFHTKYCSMDHMTDVDLTLLLPSREAIQVAATRLGQTLARLPSLDVAFLRHLPSLSEHAGLIHVAACLSDVFGRCPFRILRIDFFVAPEVLQFFIGHGSHFHGRPESVEVVLHPNDVASMRLALRSLSTLPKLTSIEFSEEAGPMTIETQADAKLLRSLLGMQSLTTAVLYSLRFVNEEVARIFCGVFSVTHISDLTLSHLHFGVSTGEQLATAITSAPYLTHLSFGSLLVGEGYDSEFYRTVGRLLAADLSANIHTIRLFGYHMEMHALAMDGNRWKCKTLSMDFDAFGWEEKLIFDALDRYVRQTEHLTTLKLRRATERHNNRHRGIQTFPPMALLHAAWKGSGCLKAIDCQDANMFAYCWVAAMKNAIACNRGRLEQGYRPICQAINKLPQGSDRQRQLVRLLAQTREYQRPSIPLFWMLRSNESNCRSNLLDEMLTTSPTCTKRDLSAGSETATADNAAVVTETDRYSGSIKRLRLD